MVLYLGRLMEIGRRDELFDNARHPYSRALIDAIPDADPDRSPPELAVVLPGEIPSALDPPSGLRIPHPLPDCHIRLRARDASDRDGLGVPSRRLPSLAASALRKGDCQRCKITSEERSDFTGVPCTAGDSGGPERAAWFMYFIEKVLRALTLATAGLAAAHFSHHAVCPAGGGRIQL